MEQHVFTIEGMSFVSGLFWYPLAGLNNAERSQEMRSLAREQDFDLYIMRQSYSYYVGFAHSGREIKSGISSAAAVVSKTLEIEDQGNEFIFVAPLPDGTWIYVAQRDGVILPDGDKSFSNEDAAKSRLLEDISLGDWSMIFAPDIWGITDSIERSFESFLPESGSGKRRAHKWWKLSPVSPYQNIQVFGKAILILGSVAALAIGSYLYFQEDATVPGFINISGETLPPPPLVHPWKDIPDAEDLARACIEAVEKAPLFPGNWTISSIKCQPSSLEISWNAEKYGWIDHIKAVIPDVSITSQGEVAYLSLPMPALTIGKDESASLGNMRMQEMYALAQRYGFVITLTMAPPPAPPLPGDTAQPVAAQDWGEMAWSVTEVENPALVTNVLQAGGFRMNSMEAAWRNGRMIWNMEGIQYVSQ